MLKKMIKGILIGGTMLGLALNSATAAERLDINLYGASAQHKFWSSMAKPFLENGICDSAEDKSFDSKHALTIGTDCTVNGTEYDNIYFRYSSRASYDGINAVRASDEEDRTRSMCNDDCSALTDQIVNLGASDVAGVSFVQATSGTEDGNQSDNDYIANETTLLLPNDPADTEDLEEFQPIVVPFGFYVSNCVKEYRCTAPSGGDKAYDKFGTACVPDAGLGTDGVSGDCIGYNQCLGYAAGYCSDDQYDNQEDCAGALETWTDEVLGTCQGGVNDTQSCDEADDCPDVALENTMCSAMPLSNISQTMARQIFSDASFVEKWEDLGPNIDASSCSNDGYIALCMRHAGSGTHATFDLVVMDGVGIQSVSLPDYDIYHFTSSSDLTKCVTDFDGAIGYADADKLLTFEEIGDVTGAHLTKYNGTWPSQRNIVNGTYEFWAAQHIYYEADNLGTDQNALVNLIDSYSSQQSNIDAINKGDYWAAQNAMLVERIGGDGGPILRKE